MNLIGQSIGRYHIVEQLGQGGMATVYKGYDTRLERYVAIKVIRREAVSPEVADQMLLRFEREAKALAKMSHPNIIKVHDYGEYMGAPYLVMEYVSGGTFKLTEGQPIPYRQAAALLVPVARALLYAHEQNIIHRDIKPANILLTETGIPMLSDFGIAKIVQSDLSTHLTGTGVGIGTPEYMAPEQGMGQNIDHRVDIYALGVVFYELVTGRKPFYADTPIAVVIKHMNDPLPPPRKYVPELPEIVEKVLYKALAKRPEDRYQTMGHFAAALEILSTADIAEPAVQQPPQTKPREGSQPPAPYWDAGSISRPGQRPQPFPVKPAELQQPPRPAMYLPQPQYLPQPVRIPAVSAKKKSSLPLIALVLAGIGLLSGVILMAVAGLFIFFPGGSPPATRTYAGGVTGATTTPAPSGTARLVPTTKPGSTADPAIRPSLPVGTAPSPGPTRVPTVSGPLQTLTINLGSVPDSLDPHVAYNYHEIAHMRLVYEGLTRLDNNLNPIPAAAERWEYNSNGTQLTFTLRPGLTYSDGVPLNARRFEYAIIRNMDPALNNNYTYFTDEIIGAYDYRTADRDKTSAEKLMQLRSAVQVQAQDLAGKSCINYEQKDCLRLQIRLKQPAMYYHTLLGLWIAFPLREELINRGGESWWQIPELYIGNGPFVMKSYSSKNGSSFAPNPSYRLGGPRYNLTYRYLGLADGLASYRSNDLDITAVDTASLAAVQKDAVLSKELQTFSGFCTYALIYHHQKPPFDDPKLRAAFSMAVDRESYIRDLLNGVGYPTLSWIPRGFPGYDPGEKRWAYNPDSARKSLVESKYGSAAKLPEVVATYINNSRNQARWEWFARTWKNVLNVSIRLNPLEGTAYQNALENPRTSPQMYLSGWCADYADPQNWLSSYWATNSSFGGRYGYSNAALDKLLTAADSTMDTNKRLAFYSDAQTLLVGGAPAAFLYNNMNVYLVKPWVKSIRVTAMDNDWPGSNDLLGITISR